MSAGVRACGETPNYSSPVPAIVHRNGARRVFIASMGYCADYYRSMTCSRLSSRISASCWGNASRNAEVTPSVMST